ncbi:uncharacterized protein LOC132685076 [Panthera onca]
MRFRCATSVHAQPGLVTRIEASESVTPALAYSSCRNAGFDHLRAECAPRWPQLPEGLFWKKPESWLSWRVGAPNFSRHGEEPYPQRENARYIGAGLNQTSCLEESCPADMQTQAHENQPMDMQNHGHGLTVIKLPEGLSSGILA